MTNILVDKVVYPFLGHPVYWILRSIFHILLCLIHWISYLLWIVLLSSCSLCIFFSPLIDESCSDSEGAGSTSSSYSSLSDFVTDMVNSDITSEGILGNDFLCWLPWAIFLKLYFLCLFLFFFIGIKYFFIVYLNT